MNTSGFFQKFTQTLQQTWQDLATMTHGLFDAAQELPDDIYIPHDQESHDEQTLSAPVSSVGSSRSFWLAGASVVLFGLFVYSSLDLLSLIITGLIISMACEKMICYFQHKISRGGAIALSYMFLVLFVLAGALLVFPFLAQQIAEILSQLIQRATGVQSQLQSSDLTTVISQSNMHSSLKTILINSIGSGELGQTMQDALLANITQIVSTSSTYIKDIGDVVVGVVGGFFSGIMQVVIVFTAAIFFSIEKDLVVSFFQTLGGKTSRIDHVIKSLYHRLGSRLKGQLFLCVCIGLAVGLGLWILSWFGIDLPNKLTLALIAGLTEFIPYLGPFLGGLPAILLGTIEYGWVGFVVVFGMYALIQQAEGNILVPVVMNHAVGVSPLLVFLSMLVCGSMLGILGVLIAVPIAVILDIAWSSYSTDANTESQK